MRAEKPRVVIDTNVWISGILSRHGAPAHVIRRVRSFGIPVFSDTTFDELESRLWKPKFDRYLDLETRERLLHDISAVSHWVNIPEPLLINRYSRDSSDDMFIHAAIASGAHWLVTGDPDLLVLNQVDLIRILSPAEAMGLERFPAP
jgi:putative PIN family toxin of toxin-antitoxin system